VAIAEAFALNSTVALALLIFGIAVLYSSVGQAGASGYIAAMALFGVAPAVMKPSALILNVLVASLGTIRFSHAGYFSWRVFLPFAIGSVPLAYLGGAVMLPDAIYRRVVGAFLLFVAYRVFVPSKNREVRKSMRTPAFPAAVACGAAVGLLAGLTGIGGGIFLAPILMLMGRHDPREFAGVSSAFILVNSLAAIAGCLSVKASVPNEIGMWAIAAIAGGLIGSELGIKHLGEAALRRLLAGVLAITGIKLLAK
jgi:uncharacterized membrane protein YfcA